MELTFQSPVWKIMPSAQRSTKPQQSGIEWVTRMGSTSKGPAWNLFLILRTLSLDERNIPNSFKRFFISCSSMNKCISKFKKIWYNFTVLMLQPTVPSSKAMNYKKIECYLHGERRCKNRCAWIQCWDDLLTVKMIESMSMW